MGGHIEVEVQDWEKYNYRKDVKNTSWFRVNHNIFQNHKFHDLTIYGKILWFFLLCEASQHSSSLILILPKLAASLTGLTKNQVEQELKNLKELQFISTRYGCVTDTLRIRALQTDKQTNKQTYRKSILDIYNVYPRKEGKQKGINVISTQITNEKTLQDFKKSVLNYADEKKGVEKKYIKMFSSFCNKDIWPDYIDYKPPQGEIRLEDRTF